MKTLNVHYYALKKQQEDITADMHYLHPCHPEHKTNSQPHETDAQSQCSSKHLSLCLSIHLFAFLLSSFLCWKERENQGHATEHMKLQENKFPRTCPFRPTASLKEWSLVKPGNIWLVKTYGMFIWGLSFPSPCFLLSLSPHTWHSNPYRRYWVGGGLIPAGPRCQCLSRGESN